MRLLLLPVGLLLLAAVVLFLALENEPRIRIEHRLSLEDVDRIKALIQQNNPRRLQEGQQQRMTLTERDVNLLLSYLFDRYPALAAHARLGAQTLALEMSLQLPLAALPPYLNLELLLSQEGRQLSLRRLAIGRLQLPSGLAQWLLELSHEVLQHQFKPYGELVKAVEDYRFEADRIALTYRWQPSLLGELRAESGKWLFSQRDKDRLIAYTNRLAAVTYPMDPRQPVSLFRLLQPLFELAAERSRQGNDARAENRALLLAFAIYLSGSDIRRLLPQEMRNELKRPRWLRVTLRQRYDLMQHFMVSAAITVSAGGGLADALGLFKELDDSRGGSGFSFADLLADRAGVRLAELAVGSRRSARELQRRMLQADSEADIMPPIDHLPEGIMELEFKRRYRDLDSASYRLVEAQIERRIARCRVLGELS